MVARALDRDEKRDLLLKRATKFLERSFVADRIVPFVPEVEQAVADPSWLCGVVRAKGTGRITLRYDFGNKATVYAKGYTDSLGLQSYTALHAMWTDGFGMRAASRVPEPLGFLPDENMLLMRRAEGIPLASLLFDGTPDDVIEEATKAAARWLAQLHGSKLDIQVEAPCERIKIFKLADMLTKASAAFPEQSPLLLDLLQKIRRLAPAEDSGLTLAPTHGQYTPANIFMQGDAASVIDLDRICLSDPAKDVAMFMHRITSLMFKDANDPDRARRICRTFIGEYEKCAPERPINLPYYKALYALKGFAKIAKDRGPDDPLRKPLEEMYLSTFESCFDRDRLDFAFSSTAVASTAHTGGSKEELGRWANSFAESDFIGQFVHPSLGEKRSSSEEALLCDTTVVQNTGTGRLTLRYDFKSGETVYAKLYTDKLGAHSYKVLKALWDNGFDDDSHFRVPEPLAFLPDHNLVLMRGVPGIPLVKALNGDGEMDLNEGCRKAARWLAMFHRSSIRVGDPEPDWDSLKVFRLSVRLVKAAAARSNQSLALLDFMHSLKALLKDLPPKRLITQTHGRYHHEHVFINGDDVAVIDLDRCQPTDPAKDVAEFLRVLRMSAFRLHHDMSRANEATQAFLDEYFRYLPEVAASLPFYWSAFLSLSLFGMLKKLGPDDPRWATMLDFHLQEMDRAREYRL